MQQEIKAKGKVFRDPVHRLIRVEPGDEFVLDLINTPTFQRLRRVRQLGVSPLTYHGAEHSRFAHSLGVYNFAKRIVSNLQRRYRGNDVSALLEEHRRVILASALLHDVGHGPFSHMIERVPGNSFDHEEMTAKLITDAASEIPSILERHGISPGSVANIIGKTDPHYLIVDIVSSQLDADRMDYLLRDSLMTGVEYGIYDAEWLLNAMCVGHDPDTSEQDKGPRTWRLCLDKSRGLFAAEQLILARYHMTAQVYMHRVTRGYEVMLLNLFKQAADLCDTPAGLPGGTPPQVLSYFRDGIGLEHADWLGFDESAMTAAFQGWARSDRVTDRSLSRLSSAYLNRELLYSAISIPADKKAMRLDRALTDAGLLEFQDWGLDFGEHLPYKGMYHKASKGGGGEEQSALSILLADGGDGIHQAVASENESIILKELDNSQQNEWRLYIDREKVGQAYAVLDGLGISHGA